MYDFSRVNTNIAALRAYQTLQGINAKIIGTAERISTGTIYNRSSQGPAQYYMSKVIQRDINNLNVKTSNIERGISWMETNDSNYDQASDILMEMSDLIESAKAGGITSAEKDAIQTQLNELKTEIGDILTSGIDTRISSGTEFSIGDMSGLALSSDDNPTYAQVIGTDLDGITVTGSAAQIDTAAAAVTTATERVGRAQTQMGAWITRAGYQSERASVEATNQAATLSSINDADLAREQMELTKLQILQSTAQSILSQLNAIPALVLRLMS
jgi:flagellin